MQAPTVEVTDREQIDKIIKEGYKKEYKTLFVGRQFASQVNKSSMNVLRQVFRLIDS